MSLFGEVASGVIKAMIGIGALVAFVSTADGDESKDSGPLVDAAEKWGTDLKSFVPGAPAELGAVYASILMCYPRVTPVGGLFDFTMAVTSYPEHFRLKLGEQKSAEFDAAHDKVLNAWIDASSGMTEEQLEVFERTACSLIAKRSENMIVENE